MYPETTMNISEAAYILLSLFLSCIFRIERVDGFFFPLSRLSNCS